MNDEPAIDERAADGPAATLQTNGAAPFRLRAFFGHHKCATGWISGIVREICFHMGMHFRIVHGPQHIRPHRSFGTFVEAEEVDVLMYTNAAVGHTRELPPHYGFHVVRDPRDVLVSAYFSHRYSHPVDRWPALQKHREALNTLSKKEGLFKEMSFSRKVFEQMRRWNYEQEQVLELKLEDLSARPQETFAKVTRFLGLLDEEGQTDAAGWVGAAQMRMNRLGQRGRRFMPGRLPMFPMPQRRLHSITASMLETILRRKSFKNMAGGREKGEENVKSHYRKGKPGDWKNHLDDDHVARFKDEYNELLLKLGYETTPNW